jgi:hypothetical protein
MVNIRQFNVYIAVANSDIPMKNRLLKINLFKIQDLLVVYAQGRHILAKDNLLKRYWQGSPRCSFCNHDESIRNLFFKCHFARAVWRSIQPSPPRGVANMFDNWLRGLSKRLPDMVLLEAGALC